ncbi:hypothetical protein NDU88_011255 [Pleurodeles waltl]|uniref:Uncharacterized protein n=1 Tax=Pleurodeles waltl TaxID=8319 RepID=A0AAV7Q0B6_PLEWA|nr:hypothetical protein NDU88_011255 [Pleurodeles waltl]
MMVTVVVDDAAINGDLVINGVLKGDFAPVIDVCEVPLAADWFWRRDTPSLFLLSGVCTMNIFAGRSKNGVFSFKHLRVVHVGRLVPRALLERCLTYKLGSQ